MSKKIILERKIICESKNRRPYGVKMRFLLQDNYSYTFDATCSLLLKRNVIVTVKPEATNPNLKGECILIVVDGFATAGEAEQVGLKVAMGLLWSAVSKSYAARLLYKTPLPCSVYDRNASVGLTMSGFATVSMALALNSIVDPINQIISSNKNADSKLLVALEIFASAKLETTERSKFVGLVSALEPLATQEVYDSDELRQMQSAFKKMLDESSLEQSIRDSLKGRIDQLNIESVSRAIRRMIKAKLPGDREALEVIEEAYGLRSKILHEGATDADLDKKSSEVEAIIKNLLQIHVSEFTNES